MTNDVVAALEPVVDALVELGSTSALRPSYIKSTSHPSWPVFRLRTTSMPT